MNNTNRQQTLYIMQGAPGSGKSFMARCIRSWYAEHNPPVKVCSTDDYFYVGGEYKFDGAKLAEYHAANLDRCKTLMAQGFTVIVDNTNIQRWACREYVRYAVNMGVPVVFVRVTGEFDNEHGVPADKVQYMRQMMEDLTVESVLASKTPWEIAAESRPDKPAE